MKLPPKFTEDELNKYAELLYKESTAASAHRKARDAVHAFEGLHGHEKTSQMWHELCRRDAVS